MLRMSRSNWSFHYGYFSSQNLATLTTGSGTQRLTRAAPHELSFKSRRCGNPDGLVHTQARTLELTGSLPHCKCQVQCVRWALAPAKRPINYFKQGRFRDLHLARCSLEQVNYCKEDARRIMTSRTCSRHLNRD